jgi:transposase
MALSYLSVDRDQAFLLPPSMREWLPEDHLVWFVLDVVERLDTTPLHARHPNDGVGRRAYDPDMLLALLVYAYCVGVRSSRQIERHCEVDVAFRVLAANDHPDHTTIARFRQDHGAVAQHLFIDVLALCAEAGLAQVGVVAIDGTKMAADASGKANRTRSQLDAEVSAMFEEAAAVDSTENRLFGGARGDELPPALADPRRRGARLDAALRQLEAQRQARNDEQAAARRAWDERRSEAAARGMGPTGLPPAELELEAARAALAREEARAAERAERQAQRRAEAAARGRRPLGRPPAKEPRGLRRARKRLQRVEAEQATAEQATTERRPAKGEDRANTTDPQSRMMKTPQGWIQGYNAQAAVNERGVVLAAEVCQDANDVRQCEPMMARTRTNLDAAAVGEPVGIMLFDAGYLSEDNLITVGPDRLIATSKAWRLRRSRPTEGPPPCDAGPLEAMEHRLRTPEGAALYAKRQHLAEPVFGEAKHVRGFRRFSRRGLAAVDAEWKLLMAAHNLLKLFRHQQALA